MSLFKFAVIGINHDHIHGQVEAMMGAGCEFAAFHAPEDDLAAAFAARYPMAKRVDDRRASWRTTASASSSAPAYPAIAPPPGWRPCVTARTTWSTSPA